MKAGALTLYPVPRLKCPVFIGETGRALGGNRGAEHGRRRPKRNRAADESNGPVLYFCLSAPPGVRALGGSERCARGTVYQRLGHDRHAL